MVCRYLKNKKHKAVRRRVDLLFPFSTDNRTHSFVMVHNGSFVRVNEKQRFLFSAVSFSAEEAETGVA